MMRRRMFLAAPLAVLAPAPTVRRRYACGGVLASPHFAATPRAFIPLPDGRTIMVVTNAGGVDAGVRDRICAAIAAGRRAA